MADLRHGIVGQVDKELGETPLRSRIVTKDGGKCRIAQRFGGLVTHLSLLAPAAMSEHEVRRAVESLRSRPRPHESLEELNR